MEPKNLDSEQVQVQTETKKEDTLNKVTPLSKYLAMVLFISMPFLGGWIGYQYAPEKVVDKIVVREVLVDEEVEAEEGFDSFYTYELPERWSYSEDWSGNKEIVAPPPVEIEESYIDDLGYYHDFELGVYVGHWRAEDIFNEDKTSMTSRWPGEYAALLSALYRSDEEVKEEAFHTLNFRVFPAVLFTTNDQRFKGVARINNFTQDYSFFAKYEMLLIDTMSGDMIVLSVELDGKEFDDVRSMLATDVQSDNGEFTQAQDAFLNLLNSKSREELSFGYLMNDLEKFANSLEGINERQVD